MNEPKAPAEIEIQGNAPTTPATVGKEEKQGRKTGAASNPGPVKSGSSASGFWIGLILLISLTALGIAAYSYYNLNQLQPGSEISALADRSVALEQRLDRIGGKFDELSTTLSAQMAEQQAANNRIDQHLDQVDKRLNERQSSDGDRRSGWRLAEVEYLLRLANQRILVERDIDGAIGLLGAADKILRDVSGISAHPAREAIASDLAALRSVATVDVDGVFLKLGASINQVDQLKQKRLTFDPPVTSPASIAGTADEVAQSGWWDTIWSFTRRVLGKLGQLVDYRRGNERIDPILPPEEEYYLRQNLRLKFEQAQIALLKGNQTAYQFSLDESTKWISRYFDANDGTTLSMLDTLGELRAVEVAQRLPDISNSLLQARQLISQAHPADTASGDQSTMESNP